jgi:hypothetical protein
MSKLSHESTSSEAGNSNQRLAQSNAYQAEVQNVLANNPSYAAQQTSAQAQPAQPKPVPAISSLPSKQQSSAISISSLKQEKVSLLKVMSEIKNNQMQLKSLESSKASPQKLALKKAGLQILNKSYLKQYRALLFTSIPDKYAVVFPAIGKQHGIINVMGHADCEHCQQFVEEFTSKLQKLGFKVRYFFAPWPHYIVKNGQPYVTKQAFLEDSKSEDAHQMGQVYCSSNRDKAFMNLVNFGSVPGNPQSTNNCTQLENGLIDFNYVEHHITATPIIVDSLGNMTKGTHQNFISIVKKDYGIK